MWRPSSRPELTTCKCRSGSWYVLWTARALRMPTSSDVDTRMQPRAKALLYLARKLPPQGSRFSDILQAVLDKLRPTTYPCIDCRHATWFPLLLVLLTQKTNRSTGSGGSRVVGALRPCTFPCGF